MSLFSSPSIYGAGSNVTALTVKLAWKLQLVHNAASQLLIRMLHCLLIMLNDVYRQPLSPELNNI